LLERRAVLGQVRPGLLLVPSQRCHSRLRAFGRQARNRSSLRHVPATGEQTIDGDVLVKVLPTETVVPISTRSRSDGSASRGEETTRAGPQACARPTARPT
jgi:hypothetical protein